ncbi:MAG TPA: class I SAM-dependent methyltransferase [Acidimicrobiia bacterium]|nr:class I SAM-dependent methyltransferase [Acidimicrobiia bacterium]
MERSDPAYRGQRDYTPFLLGIYDRFVVGFVAWAVWRCPIQPMVDRYRSLVGARHLDVGPGTGYFLASARSETDLTLVDPNPNVLRHCARTLADFRPTLVEADVLKPLPVDGPFDSAALSMVLHCLPGPQSHKSRAVRNIAAVLGPDGVLFGSTILGLDEPHPRRARALLKLFNRQGGFDNAGDTVEGLEAILRESFHNVEITVTGSAAHFVASGPSVR